MFFINRALRDVTLLSVANTSKVELCPGVRVFKRRVSSETRNNNSKQTSVVDFYAGKSVFITGGTGFLGKAFIEKILYSCTNIDNIYVLIRETEQHNATQKLRRIFDSPIFSRLKMEKPKALQKVISIVGDVKSLNLGITKKNQDILIEKVSVVIHSAASISFDNSLKEALETNYEGTKNVLSLCKRIKNIQAFVHISTAYTNTDKSIIDEVVYPAPANISDVYKRLKKHGDDENQSIKILNGRPNTYTFTKALTENLIAETHHNVPAVIIRPSMVGPSKDEPLKGWLDNLSVPSNLLLAGATGLNHIIRGKKSNVVDFVPVDYVVNLTLVAATKCKRSRNLTVYNCCTSFTNPIYLDEVFKFFNEARIRFPDNSYCFYFRKVFIAKTQLASDILTFFTQVVPAYVIDLSLFLKGSKPRFVELQKKFIPMRDKVAYFTLNSWLFKTRKSQELYSQISEQDQHIFPFNFTDIKWPEYMHLYAKSVHHFLIQKKKQSQENTAKRIEK
ncbi:unnamed protein product [Parnassius mnemosyne]|uniref:Fatty acyl-CoA reductase n=1 Tax=Parnassius mnemosyne TaxID=213953 RepID=A0AAV1M0I1_9NEOP